MASRAPFSAQVVLASPSIEDNEEALAAFRALGFKTGPTVGGGFSIEGPAGAFRDAFGMSLRRAADGRVHSGRRQGPLSSLPVSALPASLRSLVRHVLFTEPPAFGPGTVP